MDGLKAVAETWQVVLGAVGFTVWLVRLEGVVKANNDKIKQLQDEMKLKTLELRTLEKEMLSAISETKDLMFELKAEVIRSVSEMRHMNKTILNVKAEELAKLLNK